ncbi:MAG: YitT family protein [Firmicutes bacterium]|nr:YitT family protein [Bacillota bacterium]
MIAKLLPKTKKILSYPTIFLASITNALGMHIFIIPNHFAAGGVGGISNMIQHATGISSGVFMLAINVPLIVIAFIFLGHELAIKSTLSILTASGALFLMDYFGLPGYDVKVQADSQYMLAAVGAGVVCGASVATIFKMQGTTGGTDFVAALIHKKSPNLNIIWYIFAMDMVVALVSIFVFKGANGKPNITPALLSLVLMFVNGRTCDRIMAGFKAAIKFEIITSQHEEVKQALFDGVGRGVTRIPAYGMYNKSELSILVCVVRRSEIPKVQEILRQFPGTFSIITKTSDVLGQRFSSVHKGKSGL